MPAEYHGEQEARSEGESSISLSSFVNERCIYLSNVGQCGGQQTTDGESVDQFSGKKDGIRVGLRVRDDLDRNPDEQERVADGHGPLSSDLVTNVY